MLKQELNSQFTFNAWLTRSGERRGVILGQPDLDLGGEEDVPQKAVGVNGEGLLNRPLP